MNALSCNEIFAHDREPGMRNELRLYKNVYVCIGVWLRDILDET